MKQKTIKTDKATLLVVEVEQGATDVCVKGLNIEYCIEKYLEGESTVWYGLPQGSWQLLGRLPDITEEQALSIVDQYPIVKNNRMFFKNYEKQGYHERPWIDTAIESFHSLLQANEIYFDNKYAKTLNEAVNKSPKDDYESKLLEADIFREAQSKVWDKERTYIFIKVD